MGSFYRKARTLSIPRPAEERGDRRGARRSGDVSCETLLIGRSGGENKVKNIFNFF